MEEIEYLKNVVLPFLNDPDLAIFEKVNDDMGTLITIKTTKRDMGIIIGKEGNTARAIRLIFNVFGAKNKRKVSLKILEP